MKHTILFADNDGDAREKWGRLLQESGYAVRLASTPQEARDELESGMIDLSVIDVRLERDDLESDISGLGLAADKAFRHIPKIILTGYRMSYEDQRKVWKALGGEPPAVVAFVGKDEKTKTLLDEIRNAFEVWPRLSMLSSKVSEQVKADHQTIRSQARWNYSASLAISIFGFGVIVAGITLAWMNKLVIGIVASATGLLLEALGYLFFTRLDLANRRMDLYHQELLQTNGFEFLLSVAERLPADRKNVCIEQAIYAVMDSWYPSEVKPVARSAHNRLLVAEAEAKPGQDLPQSRSGEE